MRNLLIIICIAVALSALVTGCGKSNEEKAKEAVGNMLEKLKEGDTDKFAEYIDINSLINQLPAEKLKTLKEDEDAFADSKERMTVKVKKIAGETYPKDFTYEVLSAEDASSKKDVIFKVTAFIQVKDAEDKTVAFVMNKTKDGWKADFKSMAEPENLVE